MSGYNNSSSNNNNSYRGSSRYNNYNYSNSGNPGNNSSYPSRNNTNRYQYPNNGYNQYSYGYQQNYNNGTNQGIYYNSQQRGESQNRYHKSYNGGPPTDDTTYPTDRYYSNMNNNNRYYQNYNNNNNTRYYEDNNYKNYPNYSNNNPIGVPDDSNSAPEMKNHHYSKNFNTLPEENTVARNTNESVYMKITGLNGLPNLAETSEVFVENDKIDLQLNENKLRSVQRDIELALLSNQTSRDALHVECAQENLDALLLTM